MDRREFFAVMGGVMKKTTGMLCTIIASLIYGVTPVLASLTYEMGSNAMTLTFYRNILVVPVLLLVMKIMRIPCGITPREGLLLAGVGVFFRASTTLLHYSSFNYIGIGLSTMLHFLFPVFTAVIGWLCFREKMKAPKWIALILATGGVAISGLTSDTFEITGVILAAASGITYALYFISMERTPLRNMHSFKVAMYMVLINGIAIALFDIPFGQIHYVLPPLAFWYTFIMAIATSVFAAILLQMGIKRLGAGTASIFYTIQPVSSVLAGWLFLNERMNGAKILSCVLVLAAVTIIIIYENVIIPKINKGE